MITTPIWLMRATAVMWLRYERGCVLVALERGPGLCGIPDVIGVTEKREVIEVEIKRSMADFRANEKKWQSRQRLQRMMPGWASFEPHQFYFFVETAMVDKCRPLLPGYAGLISAAGEHEACRRYGNMEYPVVRVPAPKSKIARRLSLKSCVSMAKQQTGTLSSVMNMVVELEKKILTTSAKK